MTFRFSTSIQNFADRVKSRLPVREWNWKRLKEPTVFLGLYHEGDWLRFLVHRGPRLAFWCGGDILRLKEKPFWQSLVRSAKADHVCENEVEKLALQTMGINARIRPILFFDDIDTYKVTFKPSKKPHVWITGHPGRAREYGVDVIEEIADQVPEITFHVFGQDKRPVFIPDKCDLGAWKLKKLDNIRYHGWVSTEEMEKIAKKCQAGIRLNDFDGCPHVVTKGILWGQYPISKIPYPYVDSYETTEDLVRLLKKLKNKTKPNLKGREHWLKILTEHPWNT